MYDVNGSAIGLCSAEDLFYVTTSGGPMPKQNFGYEHIKALAKGFLGIPRTYCYYADGLDVVGVDAESVLDKKIENFADVSGKATSKVLMPYSRVMIVDDSKVNIIKADHILKQYGFDTVSANSGEECLKTLKLKDCDLILLDIEMPDMNGFETLEALRSNKETKNIPVIFVTSDNTMDVILKASQYHVAGYITKPYNEEELISHVKDALLDTKAI